MVLPRSRTSRATGRILHQCPESEWDIKKGVSEYLLLRPKQTSMSASTNIYHHTINNVFNNIHMSWWIPLDPKVPVFLDRWRPVYPRGSKLAGDASGSFQVRVDVSWTSKWVYRLWGCKDIRHGVMRSYTESTYRYPFFRSRNSLTRTSKSIARGESKSYSSACAIAFSSGVSVL